MDYSTLILKSGRERSVLHQHAWIYSGAIKEVPEQAQHGDIVRVSDHKNLLLGYGFYAPKNQISCRMFYFGSEEVLVDAPFWRKKILNAFAMRQQYILSASTNCYRLLHSEGDSMPGVIVDVYQEVASVQLLFKGVEIYYQVLLDTLYEIGVKHIYLKTKENNRRSEQIDVPQGWVELDPETEEITVRENGLKFLVNIVKGQKTGFFLDQRESRNLLKSHSMGKNVLNAFGYTGGFSVYAVAGGAKSVISADISKEASEMARRNVALNFPEYTAHELVVEDCFMYLKTMPENHFDLIVLDPPAFAKTSHNVPNAARGYKEINMWALKKIKSGGLLFTFSCSGSVDKELFRKIIFGAAADVGRNVRIISQLTQPADHPINIYHPEGEYLKGLVLHVE